MRDWTSLFASLGIALLGTAVTGPALGSYVLFESGPVRPLALSPDGSRLFAVNTPDATLEIFRVGAAGLAHEASVPVGLEPVAVAARSDDEVWVVNHVSDSVSIVDVSSPRVVRTLLVGDEPRDVVFANPDGPGGLAQRAFLTTAHRGQHRDHPSLADVPGAGDPQLTTPGVGRADVWVFDATDPGPALGGVPLGILTLFADTPRALAVSPDQRTVYAAAFASGNRTTTVSDAWTCSDGSICTYDLLQQSLDGALPGLFDASLANPDLAFFFPGLDPLQQVALRDALRLVPTLPRDPLLPTTNSEGIPAPSSGLIVQADPATGAWRDAAGRDWEPVVSFSLPDRDVFSIDASSLEQTAAWSGVGTTLFNMAVNPVSGAVYVSNTESNNTTRFEGPGVFGGSTVQGRLAEARISILGGSGSLVARHLNPHIDYALRPAPPGTADHALSTPTDLAVSPDGRTLYVAALGSSRVGVIDLEALASGGFDPREASSHYIEVSGGGPAGLALAPDGRHLYVFTLFDDAVSVIELDTGAEIAHVALPSPEPPEIAAGRRFLYDARLTSSNGEASCAGCHVFGDKDELAWDLGNPDASVTENPIPILIGRELNPIPDINGTGELTDFHPMKGPMLTQTLRGMGSHGAMHWRGDRATPANGTATPDPSEADERNAFRNFDVAFEGLLGRATPLSPDQMEAFVDFALALTLPPNPVRRLDNTLTPAQQAGHDFFVGPRLSDGIPGLGFNCEGCHNLDPAQGFFGAGGRATIEGESQVFKIPHLRNLYARVGMFGIHNTFALEPIPSVYQAEQVRGFGFLHDGSIDTLLHFLHADGFSNQNVGGPDVGFPDEQSRLDMEQFLLAFDSDLAPIVGQQITRVGEDDAEVDARIALLHQRAGAPFVSKVLGGPVTEADVVVKARVGGRVRGWVRDAATAGRYEPDDGGPLVSLAALEEIAAPGQEVTFTAVPSGSGRRMAIDRDGDGVVDGLDGCPSRADESQSDQDGDGVGDVCDLCPSRADPTQSDVDADGVGDRCDDLCVGEVTVLRRFKPRAKAAGGLVQLKATGVGPNAVLEIGGMSAPIVEWLGRRFVRLPELEPGKYVASVVNPEGCRSQKTVTLRVVPGPRHGVKGRPTSPPSSPSSWKGAKPRSRRPASDPLACIPEPAARECATASQRPQGGL